MTQQPPPDTGALVLDTATGRIGIVMGHVGPCVQLRPPSGGQEWDADPDHIQAAGPIEELRAKVGQINAERRLR
ncbi:hypothetical protein [Streptomyces sp. NBC_00212]|uniref:hypothetical protein n=1 Tax=Streptomyces sp. NBC_00212 TaxID=2975684 RepID=UPI0032449D20